MCTTKTERAPQGFCRGWASGLGLGGFWLYGLGRVLGFRVFGVIEFWGVGVQAVGVGGLGAFRV